MTFLEPAKTTMVDMAIPLKQGLKLLPIHRGKKYGGS